MFSSCNASSIADFICFTRISSKQHINTTNITNNSQSCGHIITRISYTGTHTKYPAAQLCACVLTEHAYFYWSTHTHCSYACLCIAHYTLIELVVLLGLYCSTLQIHAYVCINNIECRQLQIHTSAQIYAQLCSYVHGVSEALLLDLKGQQDFSVNSV